jgi:hypothetical protein
MLHLSYKRMRNVKRIFQADHRIFNKIIPVYFFGKKGKNKVRMICKNIYSLRIILRCKRDIAQKGQTIKKVLQ